MKLSPPSLDWQLLVCLPEGRLSSRARTSSRMRTVNVVPLSNQRDLQLAGKQAAVGECESVNGIS